MNSIPIISYACWSIDECIIEKKLEQTDLCYWTLIEYLRRVKFVWYSTLPLYKWGLCNLMEFHCWSYLIGYWDFWSIKISAIFCSNCKFFGDTWCEQDMMTNRLTWHNVLSNKTSYVKLPDFPVFILNFLF